MSQLRRSLLITFLSSNTATLIHFFVVVILSRLLTPSEVGIFSITAVFIGLAAIVRDFGISSYIQREKELTTQKIQSALGLLLFSSWILAGFIYLSAEYVANYYDQPGIANVLRVLSISFALVPFASFHYALLARDLQAEKQAIVTSISTIAYAITCVGLAWMGFSYMAMAWANVANIVVTIIVYVALRPKGISYRPSVRGWGELFSFGGGAILGNLVNQFNLSIPDLFLGKIAGPHEVGLFSRANGLVGIFQQVAGPTVNYNALPFIAKNHHANVDLAPLMAKSTSYLTGLAWPAYIMTAIFAQDIVTLLYGKNWLEATSVMAILCTVAAIRTGYSLAQPALLAIGRPYISAVIAGLTALARIALIVLMANDNIVSFALAICIADILTLPALALVMSKYLKYDWSSAWLAHWISIKASLPCLAYAFAVNWLLPAEWSSIARLALASTGMLLVWLGSLVILDHPLCQELPSLFRKILPGAVAEWLIAFLPRAKP